MYAIIQTGSKQYVVKAGDIVEVEKLPVKDKKTITINDVLFTSDEKNIKIGQPYVKGAKVTAEVIVQKKDKKVVSFKYKRRKGLHWKKGHRQKKTQLQIKEIVVK